MLISDSKQFVFVHVPKTGGSSLHRLLKPHALDKNPNRVYSLLRPLGLPRDYRRFRFLTHGPLIAAERVMPAPTFHSYFKFAFVRNPWARLVSEYNALMGKPHHRRHRRVARLGGFAQYLLGEAPSVVGNQLDLLLDSTGRIGVDFVGRFETLADHIREVCDRLSIPSELPHVNRSAPVDYRDFYDDDTRLYVRKHWARDVEAFGYEF